MAVHATVSTAPGTVQLIDMIFPCDANHHGTLFGGVALAHMDKVAFLAASRHGRAPFVTAASEKIDEVEQALQVAMQSADDVAGRL